MRENARMETTNNHNQGEEYCGFKFFKYNLLKYKFNLI